MRASGGAAREELGLVAFERLLRDRLGVARPVVCGWREGGCGRRVLEVRFELPAVGGPRLLLRARHRGECRDRASRRSRTSALRAWRCPTRLRASAWERGDEVLWRGGGSCRPSGPLPGHCRLCGRLSRGCPFPRADVREARLPSAFYGHLFVAASSYASVAAVLTEALSAARRMRSPRRRSAADALPGCRSTSTADGNRPMGSVRRRLWRCPYRVWRSAVRPWSCAAA